MSGDGKGKVEYDYRGKVETAAKVANVASRDRRHAEQRLLLSKLRTLRAVNIALWATIALLALAWVMWQ